MLALLALRNSKKRIKSSTIKTSNWGVFDSIWETANNNYSEHSVNSIELPHKNVTRQINTNSYLQSPTSSYTSKIIHMKHYHSIRNQLLLSTPLFETNIHRSSINSSHSGTQPSSILSIPSSRLGNVRYMGRRDGNKAFNKPRLTPRKKVKARNRRARELHWEKEGKHSPPGSKQLHRKKYVHEQIQFSIDRAKGNIKRYLPEPDDLHGDLEYNEADAMLDDLMGNTSYLTSTPTPKNLPITGKYHSINYQKIKKMMDLYHKQKQETENMSSIGHVLPTDEDLSLLIRSYRDKYGTRRKPVGIAKVLQHVLMDLRVSTSLFGEKSYTSLMTCAAHPKEALRIIQLMEDNQQPKTPYVYSILVDLYAKKGDFRACRETIDQMSNEQIEPTLPAYTSLLAACHKVISRGNAPHKLKAEAAKIGWEAWKEMRIIGINADAMAFGAIIRLFAARGQPEKCLTLIDEMHAFGVLPTTLIFTAALRSVARSHENALRFEGGYSKKNKRRELITSHHGKMAREIVIRAEQAEVEQDNGFIAALIMCAAAAGDGATAKAIVLASNVRKMTFLRNIGSDDHLRALQGEQLLTDSTSQLAAIDSSSSSIMASNEIQKIKEQILEEREYGKDTRLHSALLLAYANSMKQKGLGDIWMGVENKGYLCESSLTQITKYREPKYHDNSIPGMSSTEVGLGSMTWEEEEPDRMSKRLRRKKFEGGDQDPDAGNTLDDLPSNLLSLYQDIPDDLTEIDPDGYNFNRISNKDEETKKKLLIDNEKDGVHLEGEYVEIDSISDHGHTDHTLDSPTGIESEVNIYEGEYTSNEIESSGEGKSESEHLEKEVNPNEIKYLKDYHENITELLEDNFEMFFERLKEEIKEAGEEMDVSDEEAKVLYEMMKHEEMAASQAIQNKDEREIKVVAEGFEKMIFHSNDNTEFDIENNKDNFASSLMEMSDEYSADDVYYTSDALEDKNNLSPDMEGLQPLFQEREMESTKKLPDTAVMENMRMDNDTIHQTEILSQENNTVEIPNNDVVTTQKSTLLSGFQQAQGEGEGEELSWNMTTHDDGEPMDELDLYLEGIPASRIKRVRKVFDGTLADPSLLRLIPILRENVPPIQTVNWLKQTNIKNAKHLLNQLEEQGLVDIHILNGMLQVETSGINWKDAMRLHEDFDKKYGLSPNEFSDRLIIQMLVKKKKIDEAIAFKSKVESEDRKLDILSYGHLIEYYANREELEAALSLVKETIIVHKYPPGEKSLSKIRLIYRQRNLEEVGLMDLIGEDPMKWVRHGEQNLKRENSKTGRRNVNEIRNVLTQI